jgi:hypothetical protein
VATDIKTPQGEEYLAAACRPAEHLRYAVNCYNYLCDFALRPYSDCGLFASQPLSEPLAVPTTWHQAHWPDRDVANDRESDRSQR